jgi:hypothetical protein
VPNRTTRRLAVLLSGVLLFAALVASAASPLSAPLAQPTRGYLLPSDWGAPLRAARLAQSGLAYRGGPITASTGEVVDVRVSETLPLETSTPEGWAEFLAKVAHGPELQRLTTFIVSFDEVQEI